VQERGQHVGAPLVTDEVFIRHAEEQLIPTPVE
jgi:hypothetical protein